MRCSRCGHQDDKVLDSRTSREGLSIRRRRECLNCGHRFTTYEEIEDQTLSVIKRNGARELFDRKKLLSGMLAACQKRPVSLETLESTVSEIVLELQNAGIKEIPSPKIGSIVMRKLEALDSVAYVRFASIYRQFQDVGEFIDEIRHLERRPPADAPDLFPQATPEPPIAAAPIKS
jgi:transcriptional repressor NrdR